MNPGPDVLQRIRERLDAGLLPAAGAALHRGPMVAPDGTELTASQALAWRAYGLDRELEILIEMGREGRDTFAVLDVQPVPIWVRWVVLAVLAAFASLVLGEFFLGLGLMLLWIKA